MRASPERRRIAGLALLLILSISACGPRPLPELDSEGAQTYVRRCGTCHAAYDPRSLTRAMWQVQVDAMQTKIRDAGAPPLSDHERQVILDYLTRNAGHE